MNVQMDITNLIKNNNIDIIKRVATSAGMDVHIVGGAIRDILLGKKSADYDFIVFGNVCSFTYLVARQMRRPVVRLGRKDKEVFRILKGGITYDFTSPKGATVQEDVTRRDFTINALTYSLSDGSLNDFCGGAKDIERGIVRNVSRASFSDDPLRLLRAYRFMAELSFTIEPDTRALIVAEKSLIKNVAGERVREELFKILITESSYSTISYMSESGLLYEIFPELIDSIACPQSDYHHLDVMEHTIEAYRNIEEILRKLNECFPDTAGALTEILSDDAKALLKYAILLHDVAKPMTKSVGYDGRVHFYRHCEEGERIVSDINKRLKLSLRDDAFTKAIVKHHLRIVQFIGMMESGAVTKKSILRYFLKLGSVGVFVILHNLADLLAARGIKRAQAEEVAKIIELSNIMLDVYFNDFLVKLKNPPLITGRYLIDNFNLTPSPLFKIILDTIYEKQISGEVSNLNEADSVVRKIIAQHQERFLIVK